MLPVPVARAVLVVVALAVAGPFGCQADHLSQVVSAFWVDANVIDFGTIEVGEAATRNVQIVNGSRASLKAELVVPDGFEADPRVQLAGGSSTPVRVTFRPQSEGVWRGTLRVVGDGAALELQLVGVARRSTCASLNEGSPCANVCLEDARCRNGVCVGSPKSCDDGDPCTVDACGPEGCTTTPLECPAPEAPCRSARCDPTSGCIVEAVPDGTSCGTSEGCSSRGVCVGGVCEQRPTPDGYACRDDRCRPPGTCHSGACVQPKGSTSFTQLASWATSGSVSAMVVDEKNTLYYAVNVPPVGRGALVAVGPDGATRWTRPMVGQALMWAGDRLIAGASWDVEFGSTLLALNPDGSVAWHIPTEELNPGGYHSSLPGFEALALDDQGRIGVLLAGYGSSAPPTVIAWIDPASGRVLERYDSLDKCASNVVLDGAGHALWNARNGDFSYTEPGVLFGAGTTTVWPATWSMSTNWSPPYPLGAVPGLAAVQYRDDCYRSPTLRFVDSATGSQRFDTKLFASGVVMTARDAWVLGSVATSSADGACVPPYDWSSHANVVSVFDVATGVEQARTVLGSQFTASRPLLTASNTAVLVLGNQDPLTTGAVLELDSKAQVVSECELPVHLPGNALLADGMLYVVSKQPGRDDWILMFRATGLAPATSGWTTASGDRFGHHAPDP